jgi:hypothetical protein
MLTVKAQKCKKHFSTESSPIYKKKKFFWNVRSLRPFAF